MFQRRSSAKMKKKFVISSRKKSWKRKSVELSLVCLTWNQKKVIKNAKWRKLFSFHNLKRKWIRNQSCFKACLTSKRSSHFLSTEASPNMAPKSSQKSIVEINVDRGSKVHLPCNIQGNPLPTFTWYRLSDSGSYYAIPSSQRIIPSQTVLLIRNVDDRDAGHWVR